MRLREFIKQNKEVIDLAIKVICPNCKLDNQQREMWVLNEESLYRRAQKYVKGL